ncbi:MAG: DMT family transporter [Clostridia bacterium]|nr:DMT family transporter [Clostridia bacterium]
MIKNKQIPAMAMAALGNIIFGFSFLFSKTAFNVTAVKVTPFILLSYRFLLAFLVMNVIWACRPSLLTVRGKKWWKLVPLGLLQPVAYFICENYALQQTNTVLSAVMIALIPVVALLLGLLFLKEKPTPLQILFSILSVVGVVIISLGDSPVGKTSIWVFLLLLGAMLSAAGFNFVSRKNAEEFTSFERTYMMFLLASVSFSLLAFIENIHNLEGLVLPLTQGEFLVSVGFLGVLSSVVAFFCINYANTYLPISRSTAFSNITTVVSLLAGVFILKEEHAPIAFFASAMIIVGVWGVQHFVKKK